MGDLPLAKTYFEHAARPDPQRQADNFQALYYLAELTQQAVNKPEQCPSAVALYKTVAERGDWEHEVWWEAERAHKNGDVNTAILGYWIMAERGYEVAQNNLAFILDRGEFLLSTFVDFCHLASPFVFFDTLPSLVCCRQETNHVAFNRPHTCPLQRHGSNCLDVLDSFCRTGEHRRARQDG